MVPVVGGTFKTKNWHFCKLKIVHICAMRPQTLCYSKIWSRPRRGLDHMFWGSDKGKSSTPCLARGIFKIAAFNSSHYQFENEPFSQKKWPGLPLSPGRAVFCSRSYTSINLQIGLKTDKYIYFTKPDGIYSFFEISSTFLNFLATYMFLHNISTVLSPSQRYI